MELPIDFEQHTRELMGETRYAVLREALAQAPPVSIRLNPFKTGGRALSVPLQDAEVPWCPQGFYLSRRPNFTFDPLLHAGAYYVQEAGSMFLHQVLRQYVDSPVTMLDLCAAPGGKSTVARAALPADSLLFCNEPMRTRAHILTENIQKFGHPDVVVTNNYAADYARAGLQFDVILTDVPCSGEGMFRKDAGAIDEWSAQNVEKCRLLQREIVETIRPCLRPGGLLIYSTCTFNRAENEDNLQWIATELDADVLPIDTQPHWGITPSLAGTPAAYRFIPGFTRSEGLFMAVLRKRGNTVVKTRKAAKPSKAVAALPPAGNYVKGSFTMVEQKDRLLAIPTAWHPTYTIAAATLHVLHAGVGIGTRKGRDIIPSQSLALSTALAPEAFPRIDIDLETALAYLRKDAITLPADTPRGFVLLCYRHFALGFVKNIGNRANNLYPQEWKIKSRHTPDDLTRVLTFE